jgi:hypothetical protein
LTTITTMLYLVYKVKESEITKNGKTSKQFNIRRRFGYFGARQRLACAKGSGEAKDDQKT